MAVHNRKCAKTHSGIWRYLAVCKRRTEVDAQLGPVIAGAAARRAYPADGRHQGADHTVAPGFVRSNPTTERQWDAMGPHGQQRLMEGIAARRLGSPADIAHAVLIFASDFAGWVSGQVLSVDGGK